MNFGIKPEDKKKCVMIGDRFDTDIRFGHNAGIDTAFVLTGCHTLENAFDPNTSYRATHILPRLGHFRSRSEREESSESSLILPPA
mmetsp:Transcript_28998/g.33116  ORF Transcript_28998/g.33116 Transcript_28998/m.33116 type:complete len:86 (+) Transcript_28998:674-931(+)